jgi:hypothetical protein
MYRVVPCRRFFHGNPHALLLQLKPSPSAFAINCGFGAVLLISLGSVYCGGRDEAVG